MSQQEYLEFAEMSKVETGQSGGKTHREVTMETETVLFGRFRLLGLGSATNCCSGRA